ncbi:MAG: hypothetical protein H7Y11_00230, partial [Armatimonadetes bacterium]|nr:hypothetical protein [Anaerolineae bacterium]
HTPGAGTFTATFTASNTPGAGTATATTVVTATATATELPGVELLSNTAFDLVDSNGDPDLTPWTVANSTGDKIKCNKVGKPVVALSGECAFRFKGSIGETGSLSQLANTSARAVLEAGDTLTLSFFVNAEVAPVAKAKLRVKYSDGTDKGKLTLELTTATIGYILLSDAYSVTSSAVQSVKVKFDNRSTSSKFYLDDVSLRLIEGIAPTSTSAPRLNSQG